MRIRKSFWEEVESLTPQTIWPRAFAYATAITFFNGFKGLLNSQDIPFSRCVTDWLIYCFLSVAIGSIFYNWGQRRQKKRVSSLQKGLQKRDLIRQKQG